MNLKFILSLVFLSVSSLPLLSFNQEMFEERKKSIVYIEYFVQMEVDRQAGEGVGLVANDEGLIVCLENTFPSWIPPERFRDMKIFLPENELRKGFELSYLGQDYVTKWHYLKVLDPEVLSHLKSIRNFETSIPQIGDELWGFGITNKELDYFPYFQDGRLSAVQNLPLPTAFTTVELAVPGGPVFDSKGNFVGWALPSFPLDRDIWIGGEYYQANMRNPDESFMFLLAKPFLEDLGKNIPDSPIDGVRGWLGVVGSQPLDIDTAEFLGLAEQGAVVVSEVLEDSPAAEAGLKDRDIILGVGGEMFPRFRPVNIVLSYFERLMLQHQAGDTVRLTVLRGEEKLDLEATLVSGPKPVKAADIQYFSDLGISLREFLFGDAVNRREDPQELNGAVVTYVKRNSPADAAELLMGDWIREINGEFIDSVDKAIKILKSEEIKSLSEIVVLVKRANETSVIRIQTDNTSYQKN